MPRTGRGHRAPCCQNFSPTESSRETKEAEEGRKKKVEKGLEEVQLCLSPLVYTHITPTYPALSLPCFSCRGQLWQRLQTQRGQDVLPAVHRRAGSYKRCHLQSRTPGQAATGPTQPQCQNPSVPFSHIHQCKQLPVSLTLHYCQRELCVHHWPTQRRCS